MSSASSADHPDPQSNAELLHIVDSLTRTTGTGASREWAARLIMDHQSCRASGVDGHDRPPLWPLSPAEEAARDGELSHWDDRDDVHYGALVHPGSVVWPVVVRLGTWSNASGSELFTAALVGYEAAVRLALTLGPRHRSMFHATATCGTIGAAMAASLLLRLPRERIADAWGHAVSAMGGASGCMAEWSDTRAFHRGQAIRTGIAAALAAHAGAGGTRSDLSAGRGAVGRPVELAGSPLLSAQDGLSNTQIRVFATSGHQQTVFAAARRAAREWRTVRPTAPLRSEVTVSPEMSATEAGHPGRDWFSVRAAVRAALAEAQLPLPASEVAVGTDPAWSGRAAVALFGEGDAISVAELDAAGRDQELRSPAAQAAKWGLPPEQAEDAVTKLAECFADHRPGGAARVESVVQTARSRIGGSS